LFSKAITTLFYLLTAKQRIRCPSTIRQKGLQVLSCPDAIGRLIEKVMNHRNGNGTVHDKAPVIASNLISKPRAKLEPAPMNETPCPECGNTVEHEGGCMICRSCGFSKCG